MFFDNSSSSSSSPVFVQKQSGFGHFTNFNSNWDKSSQRCNNFQPLSRSCQISCNIKCSCQTTECSSDDSSSGGEGSSSGLSGHSSSSTSSSTGTGGKARPGNGAQQCNGIPCRINECEFDEETELSDSSDYWGRECFYWGSKSYSSSLLLQQQYLLREFINSFIIYSFLLYQRSRISQKE